MPFLVSQGVKPIPKKLYSIFSLIIFDTFLQGSCSGLQLGENPLRIRRRISGDVTGNAFLILYGRLRPEDFELRFLHSLTVLTALLARSNPSLCGAIRPAAMSASP